MERVNRILRHPLYLECLDKIRKAEEGRIFCGHDMAHFLDVARLAHILNLREEAGMAEELIYAAALLHDCGRFRQYEDGTPHEQASARIAPEILQDCAFSEGECALIIEAILSHRNRESGKRRDLAGLLYRADKMSRSCFACPAQEECSWPDGKKNLELVW